MAGIWALLALGQRKVGEQKKQGGNQGAGGFHLFTISGRGEGSTIGWRMVEGTGASGGGICFLRPVEFPIESGE